MKISVIIPTYNNPNTLPLTLQAVLNQTYSDFEVIVVNDGGQCPSEFLDQNGVNLSDRRLVLVDIASNGGVARARNVGLAAATGEIVYFIDADDLIAPDTLAFVAQALANSEHPDAILLGMQTMSDDQLQSGDWAFNTSRHNQITFMAANTFFPFFRQQSGRVLPATVAMRHHALISAIGPAPWNETLRNAEDTLFFMMMGFSCTIGVTDDSFVIYRVRSDSLSRHARNSWNGRTAAMDILLPWLASRKAPADIMAIARHMRQNSARRVARLMGAEGNRREARQILLQDLRAGFSGKTALVLLAMLKP